MRRLPLIATLCALSLGCGRSNVYRYDGGSIVPYPDAGTDAGMKVGCVPGDLALVRAQPVVMFVLDRSGSMNNRFNGNSTRWRSLASALGDVLPPVDDTMSIGALIFPSGGGDSCEVPALPDLSPAPHNVDKLTQLLDDSGPSGRTPTAMAIKAAAGALLNARTATQARAMVLATDGAPNCNPNLDPATCICASPGRCNQSVLCLDDRQSVVEVTQARAEGVPTWVIGIQNTSETDINVLNALAIAGGHPQVGGTESFYAVSSQDDLETALKDIRDQVGSCVYLSGSVPPDDSLIAISLDGSPISQGDGGWSWSNKDNGELVFAEASCDLILASSTRALEAQVECHRADAGVSDAGSDDAGADAGP